MNQQEIERKFLVIGNSWRKHTKGILYRQGYIARTQDRTVRIRIAGDQGTLTIKYKGIGLARHEFEYPIPLHEAQALLNGLSSGEIIEKIRYTFEQQGNTWEIDEFLGANQGLIIAEIELESEDQEFQHPDWLGKEVSHLSQYLNVELSRFPYTAWPKGN
jgi:CYTH domain-containing protein